ncbi:orotidine 5'-phosphate decarboxylase [Enterobacteriaceae bacterium H11S18]|uniref:orotidine 5'-phosphate decarboxylase / HUMPS family protein n=1 Tax=Dryocola clanedunensis TaxID=2925396 RepID=UPI0022F023FC|nr:orotidine 5'-phosphate decarboxylase / HUMPS family protein [Dryocola clanedunensis]MCT4708580.1 orotidine 5'-phosphate decarboxylase [Dryocola clanedunensis]MCT4709326.1 orotidine 5'-phosphate decarboxylase [Dryocola clanedunensis]
MKIQLALDLLDPRKALDVVREAGPHVDIIEVGTSLLKHSGIAIVKEIRAICPDKPLFLDMKIIDGPEREASLMAQCLPEYYSMLAVASDTAVSKVLAIARQNNATVVFDLQSVPDPVQRARELKALGATHLCVHKNADCGDDPQQAFREFLDVNEACGLTMALAGGINLSTLPAIKEQLQPEIAIVGGAILNAQDRRGAALSFEAIAKSTRN